MSKSYEAEGAVAIVGHVTRDLIDGRERLGGAAAYAARAAAAAGRQVELVTAARDDMILAPLSRDPRIRMQRRDTEELTTFSLDYTGPERILKLVARAPSLCVADLSSAVLDVPLVYLAPVAGECGGELVAVFRERGAWLALGAQGWLREFDETGRVSVAADPLSRIPSPVQLVVYSELDLPDPEGLARHLASRAEVVAVTRAERGVTLFAGAEEIDLSAEPDVREVDPTGAGDVFGVMFALGLVDGHGLIEAAREAMWAAARVVEGPEVGRLDEAMRARR